MVLHILVETTFSYLNRSYRPFLKSDTALICVYTLLFPSLALEVPSHWNRCFVPRLTSFAPDFLSAMNSASIAMTTYKVSSVFIILYSLYI